MLAENLLTGDGARARTMTRPGAWVRSLLLLAPFLALIALTFFFAQTDPDYWWHQRTGQLIWEHRALPRTDPFSFTSLGKPWITHEWLSELLFFAIASTAGYAGNVALAALSGVLTTLAVWRVCRWRGMTATGALLVALWAFAIMLPLINVRPQMATILCVAVSLLLLTRFLVNGDRRALWLLPPLFALWVNLHGGYVLGLILLALTLAGESLARLLGRPAAPLPPLLIACLASGLATLLNPHGLEAWRYPFSYAGAGNASQRFIVEWQSPDFHQALMLPFAASLLVGLLVGLTGRSWRISELLWAMLLTLMALQSTRHLSLYAIVVLPLIGARLAAIEWPPLARRGYRPLTSALPLCGWALLVTILLLIGSGDRTHLQLGRAPDETGYPAGAAGWLRAHPEERRPLFNSFSWGGYLLAQLYPERLILIDGRADVHGDDLVTRYRAVEHLAPGWRATLDDWQIGLVLVPDESPLAVVLADDPAWQEVYRGSVERLFTRR